MKQDIFEKIKELSLPVFIYGMGNGAEKFLKFAKEKNIKISGVFASDEFARYNDFLGFTVKKLSDIEKEFENFIVVVTFGTRDKSVMQNIINISKRHLLFMPSFSVADDDLFDMDFYNKNIHLINENISLFDSKSRQILKDIISFKLTGDINFLLDAHKKDFANIILNNNETFVDIGAYKGDTIELFKQTVSRFNKIYAFEPSSYNYKRLLKFKDDNIILENMAVSDKTKDVLFSGDGRGAKLGRGYQIKATSLDDYFLKKEKPTYIKIDAEGEEKNILIGAKNILKNFSPKLKVAFYHRETDIITLPTLIKKINKNYNLSIKLNPCFPAWEIDILAQIH